jgi:hypothetical protein
MSRETRGRKRSTDRERSRAREHNVERKTEEQSERKTHIRFVTFRLVKTADSTSVARLPRSLSSRLEWK